MVFFAPVIRDRNHLAFEGPEVFTDNTAEVGGLVEAMRLVLRRGVIPPSARAMILFVSKHVAKVALRVFHAKKKVALDSALLQSSISFHGIFVLPWRMSGDGFRSRTRFRTSVCWRCSSKLSWKGWILVGNAASGLDREPEVRRNHSVEKDRQRNQHWRRATSSSDITPSLPHPQSPRWLMPRRGTGPAIRGKQGLPLCCVNIRQRTASSKASMFVGIASGPYCKPFATLSTRADGALLLASDKSSATVFLHDQNVPRRPGCSRAQNGLP